MTISEATKFLSISLLTEESVKNSYRALAKKYHPDHGGNVELFRQLQEVYEFAMQNLVDIPNEKNIVTTSGRKIEDLGKGLGPMTNGRTCDYCNGSGYMTTYEQERCPDCNGEGFIRNSNCPDCNGTGKFQQARSKRIVTCRRCKGIGRIISTNVYSFLFSNTNYCRKCSGTGHTRSKILTYHVCSVCHGAGEIKIYNPVIKKGSILF